MPENKPFKLNLGALKDNSTSEEKVEILDLKKNENKEIKLEKENSHIIPSIKGNEDKKAHSLDLSQMKSKKEEKIELKTKKEEKNNKENEKKINEQVLENTEEKEVFSNYESEFKKEKQTILQRITKFKNFVKPKTRIGFVALLIGITAFSIGSLFIINPKIHNLENYKVNILKIKNKIECKIDKTKCIKKENKINTINKKVETDNKTDINKKIEKNNLEINKNNLNNKENYKLKKLQDYLKEKRK